MVSPEWDEWRKAEETEMLGMVENCVYKQVARPKDKLVVGWHKKALQATNRTERQGREVQVSTCRSRVLAGGRYTLHGKELAHASDRVNSDVFSHGPLQRVGRAGM